MASFPLLRRRPGGVRRRGHIIGIEAARAQFHDSSAFCGDLANDQLGLGNVIGYLSAMHCEPVFQLVEVMDSKVGG